MSLPRFAPILITAAMASSAAAQSTAALPSREALGRAAGCVLAGDRSGSASLARAVPGSAGEAAAFSGLQRIVGRCGQGTGLADSTEARALLAGRMAEMLYLETTRSFESRPLPLRRPEGSITPAQAIGARTRDWPEQAALAECVTAVAPNHVDRLVRSASGSTAEAAAAQAVAAALPACLNQGQSLTMTRARLRAELARAMYRFVAVVAGPLLPGPIR